MTTTPKRLDSAGADVQKSNEDDFLRTIEELHIHKAELSAQNYELKRIQEDLRSSEEQYAEIYDESPIGYATLNSISGIVRCNGRLREMLGVEASFGSDLKLLVNYIHEDDQAVFRLRYSAFFNVPSEKSYTVRLKTVSNDVTYVRILAKKLADFDGNDFIHATFTDVTEIKYVENEMRKQAYHDALTGLSNRTFFELSIAQSYAHAEKNRLKAGLLYLDLDFFKKINDTHGHKVGDLFLCEVAERLMSIVGDKGVVSRLGGDEFVILVKESNTSLSVFTEYLKDIALEVVKNIAKPFLVGGVTLASSASVGVTIFPRESVPLDQVINHADTAMYEAKHSGRNQIRFFEDEMQRSINKRIALEEELKGAILDDSFTLLYQPKVNSQQKIVGAEALLRWRSEAYGMLTPNVFVPVAESAGLIIEIGEVVIDQSFRFIRLLEDRQLLDDSFVLSINVSAPQFKVGNLVQVLNRALDKYGIQASRIRIEITENMLLELEEDLLQDIYELKKQGFTFSIDDFGTGYSSLAYLHTLPVSELKIDRSFVSGIDKNTSDNAIVETVVLLSRRLGIECVAEGVEELAQFKFLKKHKCGYFQGFMFARPVEPACFLSLLEDRSIQLPHKKQSGDSVLLRA